MRLPQSEQYAGWRAETLHRLAVYSAELGRGAAALETAKRAAEAFEALVPLLSLHFIDRVDAARREFALAYAVRMGYRNPEAFADWAALMGPIEFDVYDSDFPTCYSWGKAVELVDLKKWLELYFGL